uniref:ATP-dependent DNA helicase n=1 Tax=Lactuca sativa TaxID=4236 RepID=A0A9R1WP48_LACSA|nr:hypothetical protein LSAT_V11C100003970 [Lactuca sativa]
MDFVDNNMSSEEHITIALKFLLILKINRCARLQDKLPEIEQWPETSNSPHRSATDSDYKTLMAKRHALEAVDYTIKDITRVRLPFGGNIRVLGDDFRQVLSVVRRETRAHNNALINAIFPSLEINRFKSDYIILRAILSTRHDNVDETNYYLIGRFHGE